MYLANIRDCISKLPEDIRLEPPYELRRGSKVFVMTPARIERGIIGYAVTSAVVARQITSLSRELVALKTSSVWVCHCSRVFATRQACELEVKAWNSWLSKIYAQLPVTYAET